MCKTLQFSKTQYTFLYKAMTQVITKLIITLTLNMKYKNNTFIMTKCIILHT